MERGKKRSHNVMDDEPVTYEFSEIEIQNLKIAAEERIWFLNQECASVLSQNCGAIIERDGNTNIVITSLTLARRCGETHCRINDLADDLKVVVYASDGSWYLGEIILSDFFYNLAVVKFSSKSFFEPAKLSLIDDTSVSDSETDFLRRHSSKSKQGDNVIVVGRYFHEENQYMAAPGVLRLNRFRPKEYDCIELFTITSRFTRCGDGAAVISTSGELLGITFYDLNVLSPLLPINIINRMWEYFKKHGEMRHPSYGFDAKNVCFAPLSTLERFRRLFPNIPNGLLVEKVFEDFNAESAGLQEGDVIFACDGIEIKSFLQLWELMFAKVGDEVELEVACVDLKDIKNIRLPIGEASIDEDIYRWPRYDYR